MSRSMAPPSLPGVVCAAGVAVGVPCSSGGGAALGGSWRLVPRTCGATYTCVAPAGRLRAVVMVLNYAQAVSDASATAAQPFARGARRASRANASARLLVMASSLSTAGSAFDAGARARLHTRHHAGPLER